MNQVKTNYGEKLSELQRSGALAAKEFEKRHGAEVEAYRQAISESVMEVVQKLKQDVLTLSGGNTTAKMVVGHLTDYVDWLQWTFWDLPYFAVSLRPSKQEFGAAISACGMIYLSMRVFDDVIDRHFWYKGRRPTLFSVAAEKADSGQGAEALTILGGLLLCFHGFSLLTSPGQEELGKNMRGSVEAIKSTIIGAIMEQSPPQDWNPDYYQRVINLKNVAYWQSLYSALDPLKKSPLYPVLEQYYALAQMLNDVQDFPEDEQRRQPNLISLHLPSAGSHRHPCLPVNGKPVSPVPAAVEKLLAEKFLVIGEQAEKLPEPDRQIALLKLNESLQEAFRLGLFSESREQKPAKTGESASPTGLQWYSGMEEVIERLGPDALETSDCPVCGSRNFHFLFKKQGFGYNRCSDCSHIFVGPRISSLVQRGLSRELESQESENEYLEIQKIYAAHICDFVRSHSTGSRLLDIGFGHGYLMQLSRAFGFEVYGIDSSSALVERLRPLFGNRLHEATIGIDKIPWSGFDVVVMSHVLEHLGDLPGVLSDVLRCLNPGGLLYVAVPDMDSVQFRIFGKNLDIINPLVHFQYFAERSLSFLLKNHEFCDVEKVEQPLIPEEIAPRWMRLIRELGGNDSGELAMFAKKPVKGKGNLSTS